MTLIYEPELATRTYDVFHLFAVVFEHFEVDGLECSPLAGLVVVGAVDPAESALAEDVVIVDGVLSLFEVSPHYNALGLFALFLRCTVSAEWSQLTRGTPGASTTTLDGS